MRSFDPTMDVVLYTRSSSAEHPWASYRQETAVREHLDRHRIPHECAQVIRDATGARTERRPGYRQIVEMCDQGKAILLAVHGLSRLSRTEAIISLIKQIVDLGGRVITVEGAIDTSRTGWEGVFECLIERRACYAYLRGRREVEDE